MAAGLEASALYLDTSALIKLYVGEANADRAQVAVEEAQVIATSVVAYAEARAAFARRYRKKDFAASGQRGLVSEIDASWGATIGSA